MKTYRIELHHLPDVPASACALGYFDGLHTGHARLIEKTLEQARRMHIKSAVMTFDPDPFVIFKPDANLDHLTSLSDKQHLLESMGVDLFYVVEFTREFAGLSTDDFHRFLRSLKVAAIVCGFDYTYGSRQSGSAKTLQDSGLFEVDVISQIALNEHKVASSSIEKEIRQGSIEAANEQLGYYYSLPGTIVSGFQRGRLMNFPTANLECDAGYVMPAAGVYAGYVQSGTNLWPAMINVGHNPTFNNQKQSIEAHILGSRVFLYGKKVRFFFAGRLRDEQKFSGMEALMQQLEKDRVETPYVLKKQEKLLAPTARLWSLSAVDDILQE